MKWELKIILICINIIVLLSINNVFAKDYDSNYYFINSLVLNKIFKSSDFFRQDSLYLTNSRYIFNKTIDTGTFRGTKMQCSKIIKKFSREFSKSILNYNYDEREIIISDSFDLCFNYKIFLMPNEYSNYRTNRQNNANFLQKISLAPVIYNKKHSQALVLVYSFYSHEIFEPEFGNVYMCYLKKYKNFWRINFIKIIYPGIMNIKL